MAKVEGGTAPQRSAEETKTRNIVPAAAGAPAGLASAFAATAPTAGPFVGLGGGAPAAGGLEPPINAVTGRPFSSWGEFASSRQFLIPLLKGLGTMAASPSRYLGAAILQGVGAGAGAYEEEAAARLRQEQERQAIDKGSFFTPPGRPYATLKRLPSGEIITYAEWNRRGRPSYAVDVQQSEAAPAAGAGAQPAAAAPTAAQPTAGQYNFIGPAAEQKIKEDIGENSPLYGLQADYYRKASEAAENQVNAAAQGAITNGHTLNTAAKQIAKLPESGVLSAGPLNSFLVSAAATYNNAIDIAAAANPNLKQLKFDTKDIDPSIFLTKLNAALGFGEVSGAHERSMMALRTALMSNPSGNIPKSTANQIIANMMVENRRMLDEKNHLEEYKQRSSELSGEPGLYSAQSAREAFRKNENYSDVAYANDSNKIEKMMSTPYKGYSSVYDAFVNGAIRPEVINRVYGPRIAAYIYNM
jgi:hypothetical protein